MIKDVSLIIPCQNAAIKLFQLFESIPNWEITPNEIIVIDSSLEKILVSKDFELFVKEQNIDLILIHKKNLFPGHARNVGISKAKNSVLAFLDTSTSPSEDWLSKGLNVMKHQNTDGVWGKTYYQADKFLPKIFRACTFGSNPIKTFPGTIMKKNIFNKCGLFIETARAGEDGDWMSRAELHNINMSTPENFLKYDELNKIGFKNILKKWFRNYIYGSKLPFFRAHKDYYFYAISFVAVIIAFNWNWILASWDEQSVFYIPNITKISILVILVIYVYLRGIFLPRKKGENLSFIFPINFIFIAIFSAILDFTKILAFGYSKFFKNQSSQMNLT